MCSFCLNKVAMTDVLNFKWCNDHSYRGEMINKGAALGYPDLACSPFAIGSGKHCWAIAATAGREEMIHAVLAAIDYLEEAV
jgi:hypothetical protein